MSEPLARALATALPKNTELVVVRSEAEFLERSREPDTVSVIDGAGFALLAAPPPGPVLVITDDSLQTVVGWLGTRGWLDQVMNTSALMHPLAGAHLQNVLATIKSAKPRLLDWVDESAVGRRVRLVRASRRADRLEKLTEFYESNAVSPRTIQVLRDVAEELLTNGFYDAPVAAGIVGEAISRTRDVCLPEGHACDLAYGCQEDMAFVRVRDPFGSLERKRLVEVLSRCARTDMQVEVDESMGGAGLGLWRIFSGATLVAISVLEGRSTDILVGMWKRVGSGARPFCFHLFFGTGQRGRKKWHLNESVTTQVTFVSK